VRQGGFLVRMSTRKKIRKVGGGQALEKAPTGIAGLDTITAGGVAMATPDEPGERVAAGQRFPLEAANASWLKWKPHLPVGTRIRPDLEPLSVRLRGTFSWPTKSWGLTRTQQQRTWVHTLPDQKLLCALNLGDSESLPDEAVFEIEGQSLPLTKQNLQQHGSLAVISGVKLPNAPAAWRYYEILTQIRRELQSTR